MREIGSPVGAWHRFRANDGLPFPNPVREGLPTIRSFNASIGSELARKSTIRHLFPRGDQWQRATISVMSSAWVAPLNSSTLA